MGVTEEFIVNNLKKSDNLYWEFKCKLDKKIKDLIKLQNEIESLQKDVNSYDRQRNDYQTMYDEIKCKTFIPDDNSSSSTKCKLCGKEKWEHQ